MEGAQPPVEPLLVGCFAFFLHPLREILTWFFFLEFFFLLSNQRVHFLFSFLFFGCLKRRKKSKEKNYSQNFSLKMKKKK